MDHQEWNTFKVPLPGQNIDWNGINWDTQQGPGTSHSGPRQALDIERPVPIRTHEIAEPMEIDRLSDKVSEQQETTIIFHPSDHSDPVSFSLGIDMQFEVHEENPAIIDWSEHSQGNVTSEPLTEEMMDIHGKVDTDHVNGLFDSVSDGEQGSAGSDNDLYGITDLFERTGTPRNYCRKAVGSDGEADDSGDEYAWYNKAYGYRSVYNSYLSPRVAKPEKKVEPKVEIFEVTDNNPHLTVSKVMHSLATLHTPKTQIIAI